MLCDDRIDISEGIDLAKSNNSKECMICQYWFSKSNNSKECMICQYFFLIMDSSFKILYAMVAMI